MGQAVPARAEYIILRSGQRLQVTGYQLNGDTYHLQLRGGTAELPASEVAGIEPEEIFYPIPHVETSKAPFRELIQAGKVSLAGRLLQRPYALEGEVVEGRGVGRKQTVPVSAGTFPTNTGLFAALLTGVMVIVVGLTYFPVVALGPVVEHVVGKF